MTAQTKSGRSRNRNGPGVSPFIMKAPSRTAIVGEAGTPSVKSGISAPFA